MEAPLERPSTLPAAAELVERIGWLIKLRWLAIAGVILTLELVKHGLQIPLPSTPILGVMTVLALYNLLLAGVRRQLRNGGQRDAGVGPDTPGATAGLQLALAPVQLLQPWLVLENLVRFLIAAGARRRRAGAIPWQRSTLADVLVPRELWGVEPEAAIFRAAALASAQITVDLIALAALLHLSGGLENPFIFYSVFHVVIASILLSRRATYLEATLGFSLIGAVGLGEFLGLLNHYPLGLVSSVAAFQSPPFVAAQILVLGSTLYLTAYMATSISASQRSYEREAALLSNDVARKAELLEIAYTKVSQAERTKSQYMRKVAHELKAPLGAIQMLLKVILDGLAGDISEKSRDLVTRAEHRARELTQLTQDLLALSRAREGTLAVELAPIVPGELVAGVVAEVQGLAAQAGVTVAAEIVPGLETVEGDVAGLRQLVGNLVSNAVRYTPRGGRVAVRLQRADAGLRLEVEDTGIGIPKDDLSRIFEEFFRSANARGHTSDGTGLGLSIVRAVAEQHGGKVSVESEPGRGTRFTVNLPLKPPADTPPKT
jgi:signal transduction histidine kinase